MYRYTAKNLTHALPSYFASSGLYIRLKGGFYSTDKLSFIFTAVKNVSLGVYLYSFHIHVISYCVCCAIEEDFVDLQLFCFCSVFVFFIDLSDTRMRANMQQFTHCST